MIIVLDSGPLGKITHPTVDEDNYKCKEWLKGLLKKGYRVTLAEIVDYELRRELLRAHKVKGVERLDNLKKYLLYVPITTETMLKAAELWAEARNKGKLTADDKALDIDVILAAQTVLVAEEKEENVVVATTNPKHLSWFVDARSWEDI